MGSNVHKNPISRLRREDGSINLGNILIVVALLVAVYMGVIFIPPYVDNGKLQEAIRHQARQAKSSRDNDRIITAIFEEIDLLGLDIPYEALAIRRRGRRVEITLSYSREVRFVPTSHTTKLSFSIREGG